MLKGFENMKIQFNKIFGAHNKTIDLETMLLTILKLKLKTENHDNIVEQNNKTKSLNTFRLDDNFQNRKARRNFVKIMNA